MSNSRHISKHMHRCRRLAHSPQAIGLFIAACAAGAIVAIGVNRSIERQLIHVRQIESATHSVAPQVILHESLPVAGDVARQNAIQFVQWSQLLPNQLPPVATAPASPPKPAKTGTAKPIRGPVIRLSGDTLVQQDTDYQLKLIQGSETRLTVRKPGGRIIFNGTIDTPEQRSRMPMVVRSRVEQMEQLFIDDPPSLVQGATPKTLVSVAKITVRQGSSIEENFLREQPPAIPLAPDVKIGSLNIEPIELH